ncbi:MAG TPA: hypothetical protein VII56_19135 [Rhizomicrobium sp.]
MRNVRGDILDYLCAHSLAAETAKGINCVWLGRSADPQTIREVELVLEELVRDNLIEKHGLPGGMAVYRRHHRGSVP